MKKYIKLGLVLVFVFMITGCVKIEVSMGINKDKSMDFMMVQAFDESLMENSDSPIDKTQFEQFEDKGFLVREYNKDSMTGYEISKKFGNIDDLSTEDTDFVSDLGKLSEEENVQFFSIKKGFLKNTYKAKIKMSSNDMNSELGNMMGDDSEEEYYEDDYDFEEDYGTEDDLTLEDDYSYDESEEETDMFDDMDYTQMMSGMEMNFVVKLPYKAVSHNATSVDNNGKTLTWDLLKAQNETIDFEFELYNMTNVYIVGGIALVVVILVVSIIIKSISKGKSNKKNMSNNVGLQNNYVNNNQTNNDLNNSFSSTDMNTINTQSINPIQSDNFVNSSIDNVNTMSTDTVQNNNFITPDIDSVDTVSTNLESSDNSNSILNDLNSVNYTDVQNNNTDNNNSI